MSIYANNPFVPALLSARGVPTYLFGSYDFKVSNSKYYVTNVALTSNVATVTVQLMSGPLPLVGQFISITGSATSSGVFNVSRAVITATTVSATTGAGTISFALTNSNVGSTADSGTVITEPVEIGESAGLANSAKSLAVNFQTPHGESQMTVPVAVTFAGGVLPTAITVTLQVAIRDVDSEYTSLTTVATVAAGAYTAGPVVQATLQRGYFYRLITSGLTLGSATGIIGKIGG